MQEYKNTYLQGWHKCFANNYYNSQAQNSIVNTSNIKNTKREGANEIVKA